MPAGFYRFLPALNVGVPSLHTAVTRVLRCSSSSPVRKVTTIRRAVNESTCTRQPFSGWALRSLIVAPVQRTVTCPPATLAVRSFATAVTRGLGVVLRLGAGEGIGVAEGVVVAEVARGLAVAVGLGFTVVGIGCLFVGVLRGTGASALTSAVVMSRPALSMATQAVADTPTTAVSQIVAAISAERRLFTMSPLCHLRGQTAQPLGRAGRLGTPPRCATSPHGVACCRGDNFVDRG
jgi:hypothetical protein